jgi:hypothetical protein
VTLSSDIEAQRLRAALLVAADDLDKAANQFEGLRLGNLPVVSNPEKFAEKARRAREATR